MWHTKSNNSIKFSFWGSFQHLPTLILGYQKLGNLIDKHIKFNVFKNDCTCARNIMSSFCKCKCEKGFFYLLRSTRGQKGGVTLMVMDCGVNFIWFMVPDQGYCNKSQKSNNILFKTVILQKINASLPFYTDLGLCCTLIACEYKCFFLKRIPVHAYVNTNQQPNMQQNTYIMFSKISTYTHQIFRFTSTHEART